MTPIFKYRFSRTGSTTGFRTRLQIPASGFFLNILPKKKIFQNLKKNIYYKKQFFKKIFFSIFGKNCVFILEKTKYLAFLSISQKFFFSNLLKKYIFLIKENTMESISRCDHQLSIDTHVFNIGLVGPGLSRILDPAANTCLWKIIKHISKKKKEFLNFKKKIFFNLKKNIFKFLKNIFNFGKKYFLKINIY